MIVETYQYAHNNSYCLFKYHDCHDYQIIANPYPVAFTPLCVVCVVHMEVAKMQ